MALRRLGPHEDDVRMTARRVVIVLTCVAVAALGAVVTVTRWEYANRIATIASALATVAAVGVAVWAALPGSGAGVRASRTGNATARGRGSRANTGLTGPPASGPAVADRTGDAEATGGGSATTGVDRP
jgi:hypothetical protein